MNPTRLSQLQAYTSPWLKAADLQGRPATVTIEKAVVEDIRQQDGRKEARVVVAFRGKSKRLICNKTQALALASFAKTEEFARWVGLTVVLQPAKTRSGQDTINVLPGSPATATTQSGRDLTNNGYQSTTTDDNPFEEEDEEGES